MKIRQFAHRRTNTHPCTLLAALLERCATFDSFFYILGQLTGRPTKLLRPIFYSPLCHRAVAPPAGPNDEADLCVTTHFLRNLLDNFEGTFAGNGKKRVLFCADKTPRLNAAENVHVCVFVLLCANTLIFKRPVY